jgi:hypothetical protein
MQENWGVYSLTIEFIRIKFRKNKHINYISANHN